MLQIMISNIEKAAVCIDWQATTREKRSGCCNSDENRIEQCFAAHIVHSCQQ
jgi:hypothetical protein